MCVVFSVISKYLLQTFSFYFPTQRSYFSIYCSNVLPFPLVLCSPFHSTVQLSFPLYQLHVRAHFMSLGQTTKNVLVQQNGRNVRKFQINRPIGPSRLARYRAGECNGNESCSVPCPPSPPSSALSERWMLSLVWLKISLVPCRCGQH